MKTIVVDGIIGAGKSTLIKMLLHVLPDKMVHVKEPVDKWQLSGRLERFYQDPAKRALQFQIMVFHDRIKELQKVYSENPDAKFLILERSIFTDILFMQTLIEQGLIDDSEFEDYFDMWEMWKQLMPVRPDVFLYLRPSLETCMARIEKRGRTGEVVDIDYQRTLLEKHDAHFCNGVNIDGKNVPVLTIKTDAELSDDIVADIIKMLVEKMKSEKTW